MSTLEALKAEIETAPEPLLRQVFDFVVALKTKQPAKQPSTPPVQWPDFAARLKAQFGDRVTPDSEDILDSMREDRF